MAEMLPAVPSAATQSDAERKLFARFKHQAPADWIVLHSLGLRRHERKPWAEADFVVITSKGVTLVEVKGGAIRREGRTWFTNDKELDESPFDQVAGAAVALTKDLHRAIPAAKDGLVMSAVAFPDVTFAKDGPDIVPEIVYDERDRDVPVESWLERTAEYWSEKIDGPHRERRGLSRGVRGRIVEYLAGDFDLRPSLRARLGEINDELIRLTEQQNAVMTALASNPRMLVQGGAGTGKTWLALEEALRVSADGGRALLMCHTKSLAAWLRERLEGHNGIDVVHFHGLTTKLIKDNGLTGQLSPDVSDDQRFSVEHPELALQALVDMADPPLYDAVIVDEAQDILTVPAIELLDGLLSGGLDRGAWRLFLDPRQDITGGMDVAAKERLRTFKPTDFRLTVNCRNTAEIALQTAVTAGRALEESLPVSGPDPQYIFFTGEQHHREEALRTLRSWLDGGIRPSDIVVLGTRSAGFGVLPEGKLKGLGAELVETTRPDDARRVIRYSTVANFKGLEADAVLLLDCGRLPAAAKASADIYVAMSRARSFLSVGIAKQYETEHQKLFGDFGARAAGLRRDD